MHNQLRIHLILGLISLFLAFMLWLIAKQGVLSEDWMTVNLELQDNIPPNMTVDTDIDLNQVEINVQFSLDNRQRVVSKNFAVRIDAMDLFPQNPADWIEPDQPKREKRELKPEDIHLRGVRNVKILGIDPAEVTLTARLETMVAKIDVVTTGNLHPYWMLAGEKADPDKVLITGHPDELESFEQAGSMIRTELIDLSTLNGSGQKFLKLVVPKGLTVLNQQTDKYRVHFAMNPRMELTTITDVPIIPVIIREDLEAVIDPPVADVVVYGPLRTLDRLTKFDFRLAPAIHPKEEVGQIQDTGVRLEWATSVNKDDRTMVEIRECKPPRITVKFVAMVPGTDKSGEVINGESRKSDPSVR